jgi:chromosome segregation ATPase
MANRGISREQVFALLNDNPELTNREIREALGGTGSLTTISAHAGEWRDAHRRIEAVTTPLPEIVAKAIIDWNASTVAKNRADVLADLAKEKASLADVQKESAAQAEEIERLQSELNAATTKLGSLEIVHGELKAQHVALTEKSAIQAVKLETLPSQISALNAEVERLRKVELELAKLKGELEEKGRK